MSYYRCIDFKSPDTQNSCSDNERMQIQIENLPLIVYSFFFQVMSLQSSINPDSRQIPDANIQAKEPVRCGRMNQR